ncbi:Peptidyl-prolyl cis-trans isomerase pin4 [Apiospora kogelbergensis]|uniref:Peptidyl-prolyl cis-trans isomerase n=1 Tax=Apiospora kogelbergensis TaxID=1337665 RepID=A0AAW0R3M4_9PEZI
MAKGNKSKNDTQAADGKGKGKGGKGGAPEQKAAPVKGAQSAKIRHILGNFPLLQCAKFSKKEEALALLVGDDVDAKDRPTFSTVAQQYSEDKAKQGGLLPTIIKGLTPYDPAFMEVAFSLPECKPDDKAKYATSIGQVKTENGYHILLREPLK